MKTYEYNGECWYENSDSLLSRAGKWVVWVRGRSFRDPFPVAFVGHRATIYSWGVDVRVGALVYVLKWRRRDWALYGSPDGTPGHAIRWFFGTPEDIQKMSRKVKL